MSGADVEIVTRGWMAFKRGDAEEARAVFSPEIVWDVSRDVWGDIVGGGRYVGLDGVLAWVRDLYSAWASFEMEVEEVIDAGGGAVVTVLLARGRGRSSGIAFEHRPAGVYTVRDGRIASAVWFPTREDALRAVRPKSRGGRLSRPTGDPG